MQISLLTVVQLLVLLITASVSAAEIVSTLPQAEAEQATRKSRSLILCWLWNGCDDDSDDEEEDERDQDNDDEEEEDEGILGDFCLGIFRKCKDDEGDNRNYEECEDRTDGLFGGRPLFGDCGAVTEFVDGIFTTTDTDEDGEVDSITIENLFGDNYDDSDKPFGLGIFPEGGLLWRIFNRDEDTTLLESLLIQFRNNTNQFTNSFLEDWSDTAIVQSNMTCDMNSTGVVESSDLPACLDWLGQEGFWVCRTLFNPFRGDSSSKNVCIGQGAFLLGNDKCGCCEETVTVVDNSSGSNETTVTRTSVPTCPKRCPCPCGEDDDDDRVLVESSPASLPSELFPNLVDDEPTIRCVDPRWAVSVTSRFADIKCVEECDGSYTE